MKTKKIAIIMGTRPEAIKLCPLVIALKKDAAFDVKVCVTGQHRSMIDPILRLFSVAPDTDLKLMAYDQQLPDLTANAIKAICTYLIECKPELVIVQGDTTTAFCGALAAYYQRIPVAHVEAGLRTGNNYAPYPEEVNRKLISAITDVHFAPTENARKSLRSEGIADEKIVVTGNTVIDALIFAQAKIKEQLPEIPTLPREIVENIDKRIVLITGHRRESFGEGFENICTAIKELALKFPDVAFVYPVHLNPHVRKPVMQILSDDSNVYLIDPLGYLQFVYLMQRSAVILTDSGGVQEEAPSLGKPVLVMRAVTERQEGVEAGAAKIVGTGVREIVDGVSGVLEGKGGRGGVKANPFGNGGACGRIVDCIRKCGL